MRAFRNPLLIAATVIAVSGAYGVARAQTRESAPANHVLIYRLPNGQVEQVRYTGNVPPTVVLVPEAEQAWVAPMSPFAMLERMSAEMDRRAAILFQNINNTQAPGSAGFGVIPMMSGPGVCARSVQITFTGNGQAPHVVSRTMGDCGPASSVSAPVALPTAPVRQHTPAVIEAKAATSYQHVAELQR